VTSIEQALQVAGDVEEVMVIGGGAIYSACLPLANKLYITHIDARVEGDTQFPAWSDAFVESYSESYLADEKNAYNMRFVILEKSL